MKKRLNSKEAGEFLGISLKQLARLRERRKIQYYRLDTRTITYEVEELERFLAECDQPRIARNSKVLELAGGAK